MEQQINLAPLVVLLLGLFLTLIEEAIKFAALAGWTITMSEIFKRWLCLVLAVIGAALNVFLDGTVATLFLPVLPPTLEAWLIFLTNVIGLIVGLFLTATALYILLFERLSKRLAVRVLAAQVGPP